MSYIGALPVGYAVGNPLTDDDGPLTAHSNLALGGSHLGFSPNGSWLEELVPLTTGIAQFSSLWQPDAVKGGIGGYGVLGGARTTDAATAGATVYGVGGYAIADAPVATGRLGFAGYFEARRMSGAGDAYSVHSRIVNYGSLVDVNPYSMLLDGITPNMWLASGRSGIAAANPASCALGVFNDNGTFSKGVVFGALALAGNDGVNGTAEAISFPKGDAIVWREPATGAPISRIVSATPDRATEGLGVLLLGGSFLVGNYDNSATHFRVDGVNGADNYIIISSALSGTAPVISSSNDHLRLAAASGEVHINDDLIVEGGLSLIGAITLSGSSVFNGPATFTGTIDALAGIDITGGLGVSGNAVVGGSLTVTGPIDALGGIDITGGLGVSGASHFTGDISTDAGITSDGDIDGGTAVRSQNIVVRPNAAGIANVTNGWTLYTDTSDGLKLKARFWNGTTASPPVTIGTP